MFKRLLIAAVLLLPQVGCGGNPGCVGSDPCTRILFVGNSFTQVNDLPTTFANLADSGKHHVETGVLATGGDDGIHPTTKGTYLVACVFYATVFKESPVGLEYHSDLSDSDAATLQKIASDTVLNNRAMWGLT